MTAPELPVAATKKMLIETDPHQVRIAVLEADRLVEVYVEPVDRLSVVGNLYRGKVTRVLPGMQAAFVDIGLERDAFLYVSDVAPYAAETGPEDVDLGSGDLGSESLEGGGAENGRLGGADGAAGDRRRGERALPPINELLQAGEEILVQVTKDALGTKGARVTTHVTLPGRTLVLLPGTVHHGVSRRIEDEAERERLRAVLDSFGDPANGWIVRTAGEDRPQQDFVAEREILLRQWQRIGERHGSSGAPTLIHRDLDLAMRVVRDVFGEEFSALWVDDAETYERIVEFLDQMQPTLVDRVRLETREDEPLFDRFRVEEEIEAALKSKVWLRSGGYLVINQTEALVAIDVNTGRYVGRRSLEETVLRTNLEAVGEIVRQIRLRDLSGILVIDLIDMVEEEHRRQVFAALEQELAKDRSKSKVLNISEFGLVELTRKRSHANLESVLTRRCPYCRGSGRIKALRTVCLNIRREALRNRPRGNHRDLMLRVHPEVAAALQGEHRSVLDELESAFGSQVLLQSDPKLHHETFDLTEA